MTPSETSSAGVKYVRKISVMGGAAASSSSSLLSRRGKRAFASSGDGENWTWKAVGKVVNKGRRFEIVAGRSGSSLKRVWEDRVSQPVRTLSYIHACIRFVDGG